MAADYTHHVMAAWRRARPDLDTSPVAVVSRILRAAQMLQIRLDAAIAADSELSHKGDLDTLTALRRSGEPLSPTHLAAVGQLTSGGMTNRLDRLEALGLIERSPDPTDRRAVLVALTDAGQAAADEGFAVNLAVQESLLTALTDDDRTELADLLEQMLVGLGDTV